MSHSDFLIGEISGEQDRQVRMVIYPGLLQTGIKAEAKTVKEIPMFTMFTGNSYWHPKLLLRLAEWMLTHLQAEVVPTVLSRSPFSSGVSEHCITFGPFPRSHAGPSVIRCICHSGCVLGAGGRQRRQGKDIPALTLVFQWANMPKDGQSCPLTWQWASGIRY